MRSNKGKLLAPPTAKEVIGYHAQELWQRMLHPRQFLSRRYGYRHGVVGRLGFMLTLIAFVYFALVYIQEKISLLLQRMPVPAYVAACSVFFSCLLIQGFNLLPAPNQSLDVSKLMEPFSQISSQSIYHSNSERLFLAKIPEELKRADEVEYMMVEPFTVAYNENTNGLWNTQTDDRNGKQTIAKPALPKIYTEHKVESGENFSLIAKAYGTSVQQLQLFNPEVKPKKIQIGEKILIPGASQPKKIKRRVDTTLRRPVNGDIVNSPYGYRRHPIGGNIRFHHGVDFKSPYGTNVYASMDGVIVEANGSGALGRHIIIRHANGLETVYAHLSKYHYKRGDSVSRGQNIGTIGSTGRTNGPHLHFEIRKNGKSVDPSKYVTFRLRKK